MNRKKEQAPVLSQTMIAPDIYDLIVRAPLAAKLAKPGQFVSLYPNSADKLLPRPVSICGIDAEKETLRLVYRIAGAGTKEISQLKQGDTIDLLGPLGNGFFEALRAHGTDDLTGKKVLLIGGGIGVPPLLELAAQLPARPAAVLGYRDRNLFLKEAFDSVSDVYIATDDGSAGIHGTVIDAARAHGLTADVILACGPKPMLAAVAEYADVIGADCFLSLEERMACGVGACLACVCKTVRTDAHSNVKNARICKDGPVFFAKEVDLS